MSTTDSDSESSYKRGKKRNRSRSKSNKRKKKSKTHKDTRSRDRSASKHSRSRTFKDKRKSSRDKSSKDKSLRDKSPMHKSYKYSSSTHKSSKHSPINRSPFAATSFKNSPSRDNYTSDLETTKNKKTSPSLLTDAEKIDTKEQIRKALQAAAAIDKQLCLGQADAKQRDVDFSKQQQRVEQINDIDSGDFFQSDFKSTRSEIPLPQGNQIDASHASAMFGSYTIESQVVKPQKVDNAVNDIVKMMHPNLLESTEIKYDKWKDKLFLMRKNFLKMHRGQLPWQV